MYIVKLSLTLFFIVIFSYGTLYSQNRDSQAGDEKALLDLYNSTNGDNWHDRSGWGGHSISLEHGLAGITVARRDGELRVTAIDMQKVTYDSEGGTAGNNLTGTLQSSLGNLKYAEILNLKQNNLSGALPPGIGYMTRLKRLSLGGQQCDLNIDKITDWHEGRHRGCRGTGSGKRFEETNEFSGPLPGEWGNLKNIELIEVRRQYLTGSLPDNWGNLSTLRALFINDSKGNGPDLIGGDIPDSWGGMESMQWFQIANGNGHARFTGFFPQNVQDNWSNLNHIKIDNNKFSGPFPEFPGSKKIKYVRLSNNNFTGEFPDSYFNGNNSNIDIFSISENKLTGPIPDVPSPAYPSSKTFYNPAAFHVSGNKFNGPLPEWIQRNRRNVQFQIRGNNFNGQFPVTAAEQENVRLFWIDWNNFSGELPDVDWQSDRLTQITINGNDFEGPIPESWGSLIYNHLDGNGDFTGRFYRFEARDMNLSGPIPLWVLDVPEWGPEGSHNLRRFRIQGNRFTFRDLLPTHEYLKTNLGDGYIVAPQKPFGVPRQRTTPSGGQLVLDMSEFDYEGNRYQWTKDGTPISGANAPRLTLSNVSTADEGEYVLQVSNPALPELGTHSSEPITFQIGADDGVNDGVSEDGDNDMGSDEQVLLDLYKSTNGDNWYDRTGWNGHSISLEDELAGITVAMRDGELRVTAIDMQKVTTNSYNETLGNNLTGTLPSSLGNLKYVEKLNVKQNRLTGGMPPEIGNMTRLKRLSLAGQQCDIDLDSTDERYEARQTGTCNSVGDRKRFEETNKFSGPLPGEWGNLENIELIEVSRQYLKGTLPGSWGNLSTLRALFINDSKGSGQDLIGGEIPESWGGMVSMKFFKLANYNGNARFTGTFPQSAQDNWTNLHDMSITTNEFEGPIPEFPNSTNIRYVSIANNNFSGGFPTTYFNGNNSGLDKFIIRDNNLTGTIPDIPSPSYPDSKSYYAPASFDISGNNFDEPLPYWIQGNQSNKMLQIGSNNPTGQMTESAGQGLNEQPLHTELRQNYPNPFNPTTRIEFALTDQQKVRIEVYNIAGRRVATLVNDVLPAGNHAATFDASNLASGVYLYRFISNTHRFTRKMTIVK